MRAIGVIAAGGSGVRFGVSETPKQLIMLDNRPIILHSLEAFLNCEYVDQVIVVMAEKFIQQIMELLSDRNEGKILSIIPGGMTRQESIFNALSYLKDLSPPPTIVVIHDAVRPFVKISQIEKVISAAEKYSAATLGIKATDTITRAEGDKILEFLPRQELYHIQTPQAFKFDLIYQAHKKALEDGIYDSSDDAQLVKRLGFEVQIVEGNVHNIKITTPFDLLIASEILKRKREDYGKT